MERTTRVALTILMLIGAGCSAPLGGMSARDGACNLTPVTAGRGVVGVTFAKQGANLLRAGQATQTLWVRRDPAATEFLSLHAERIDQPWVVYMYTFERVEGRMPGEWPAGWDVAHTYPSEFAVPESGCWRLSVVGGSHDDAIVLRVDPGEGSDAAPRSLPTFPGGQRPEIVVNMYQPIPAGCGPIEVADLITRFVDAFNRGDERQLVAFFGPEFQWFSFSKPHNAGGHFVAYNRDELPAYFAGRRAKNERLALTRLQLNGGGASLMHVAYDLEWRADDGSGEGHGKGAVNCQRGTLTVWSMGSS
jgi:hypothetical protein